MLRRILFLLLLVTPLLFNSCGYNRLQALDEETKSAWSEVLNQYQRRADLVPNLVNVVKGYAAHEREVLEAVTAARSRVGAVTLGTEQLSNPQAVEQYLSAQREMTGALSRLIAVAENYPQLKADGAFRDLQAQLEGTENRVTVARNRYIQAVKEYNIVVRSFPSNITARAFGMPLKTNLSVENERELAQAPKVDLSK